MIIEVFIFVITALFLKRLFHFNKWNHFPGASGWTSLPWIGHGYLFGEDALQTLYDFQKKYGDVFRLDLSGHPTVFIADFEAVQEAFKKEVR